MGLPPFLSHSPPLSHPFLHRFSSQHDTTSLTVYHHHSALIFSHPYHTLTFSLNLSHTHYFPTFSHHFISHSSHSISIIRSHRQTHTQIDRHTQTDTHRQTHTD